MRFGRKVQLTENALIKGCVKNQATAQRALYEQYSGIMFAICLRYADNYHTAEDLLQEGFVKVFTGIKGFQGRGSFEGWMKRIFVNTAIEYHRRNHHLYAMVDVGDVPLVAEHASAIDKLAADDLLKMISELSPGYRTVFNLYAIEGYTHQEIASMLKISEGTSKSQLARARQQLQKRIEAQNQTRAKALG